jgi:outer membrane protein TolC
MKVKKLAFILIIWPLALFSQETWTLQNCIDNALLNNRGLMIDKQNTFLTEQAKKAAFSQFMPNISFTGSYTRLNKQFSLFSDDVLLPVVPYTALDAETGQVDMNLLSDPAVAISCIVIDPSTMQPVLDNDGNPVFRNYAWLPKDEATFGYKNNYLLNLGLIQPVYLGGKIRNFYKISEYTQEISVEKLSMDEKELIFDVQNTYWQIVVLAEKVKLANKYKELVETFIKDLNNYQSEGIITSSDLLKAQIKLNEAELNITKAQNGYEILKMSLNNKTGQDIYTQWNPADSSIKEFLPEIFQGQELYKNAKINRPEISILEMQTKISQSEVNMAKGRFMPDIGITANYFYINPSPYQGFKDVFDNDYTLGLTMNVPLFHWGERWHTLKMAEYQLETSRLELEDAKDKIQLEIQLTLNEYNEALKKLQLMQSTVDQATENLRIVNNRFHEGMAKVADVLEAQTMWLDASVKLLDAKAEVISKKNKITKVSGKE